MLSLSVGRNSGKINKIFLVRTFFHRGLFGFWRVRILILGGVHSES